MTKFTSVIAGFVLVCAVASSQPAAPANLIIMAGSGGGTPPGGGGGGAVEHSYTVTHYVAPHADVSGSQSHDMDVTNSPAWGTCTSRSTPCTAGRAFANANDDEVVEFAAGAYIAPGAGAADDMTFKPLQTGSSGNPITYVARYPAAANLGSPELWTELRQSADGNYGTSAVLGAGGHNAVWGSYYIFDGFYIDDAGTGPSATGSIRSYSANASNSNHIYRRLVMDVVHENATDNFNAIQIHGTSNVTVVDSVFRGTSQSGLSDNAAVITAYSAPGFEIAYNTFENTNVGLFLKGESNAGVKNYGSFHHNKMTGGTNSLISIAETDPSNLTSVYQNLVYDFDAVAQFGIEINNEAGSADLQNVDVYNNTVVTAPGIDLPENGLLVIDGGVVDGTNVDIYDNIFAYMGSGAQVIANAFGAGSTQATNIDSDYNRFYSGGSTPVYAYNGDASMTLAEYRSATGWETNSSEGDPVFEDVSADNYALDGASPVIAASSTGGPVGAYETAGPRASPGY